MSLETIGSRVTSTATGQQSFYDSEHAAFRDSVSRFLDQALDGGGIPTLAAVAEQGLLGIGVPESCGGAGVSDLRFAMVMIEEAMRRGSVGTATLLGLQSIAVIPVLTEHRRWVGRQDVLADIAEGRGYVGIAGAHQPLSARVDGGDVVVDGVAASVLHAPLATHLLVNCIDGEGDPVIVLVGATETGVAIGTPGRSLGAHEAGVAQVDFDRVRLPVGAILTERQPPVVAGEGIAGDLELFLAAVATAGAGVAIAGTGDYTEQREVFGRPLSSFENTGHVMSTLGADLIIARSALREAVTSRADGPLPAALTAALAVTATRLYGGAADEGLQLHGGYGYMHEYPIARAFGDAQFFRLLVDRYGVARRCRERTGVSL